MGNEFIPSRELSIFAHPAERGTDLVDVLQRSDTHPFARISERTRRLWKTHFADQPS